MRKASIEALGADLYRIAASAAGVTALNLDPRVFARKASAYYRECDKQAEMTAKAKKGGKAEPEQYP